MGYSSESLSTTTKYLWFIFGLLKFTRVLKEKTTSSGSDTDKLHYVAIGAKREIVANGKKMGKASQGNGRKH
jgi:hypothetical protein